MRSKEGDDGMRMGTRRGLRRHAATLGLLIGALALGVAEAAKPGSGPELLTGAGSYTESALFGSTEALDAVQAGSAVNPALAGDVAMSGVDFVSLVRGLEVDGSGVVHAIFHATDATSTFSGILEYQPGVGIEVALAAAWQYEDAGQTTANGAFVWAMDRVPAQPAGSSGPLLEGDIVVVRWVDDDTTSDGKDGRLEIALYRPSATGPLAEVAVLRSFSGVDDLASAKVAVDGLGNVFMRVHGAGDTGGALAAGLYRLFDSGTGAYTNQEMLAFPFDIDQHFEVDASGALYVLGARGGANAGTIFRLLASADPATDATEFATFTEDGNTESFNTWTVDGGSVFAIAMSDLNGGDQDYVGLVDPGADVAYGDRIADSAPRGVIALSADANGSVYVIHEDKSLVSRKQYAVDGYTVYRLELDTSGGGNDTGGGGKGGGKGKNR